MRTRLLMIPLMLLSLAFGCGGGGGTFGGSVPTGTLTVRMGTDSFQGFDQVVVSLEKIEASTSTSGWITLQTVQTTYDLMALQNGHSAILTSLPVPPGTYTQFRLTWATVNYSDGGSLPSLVKLAGSVTRQPMSMPMVTVIPGPVTVPDGGNTTAQIMFSGMQAVQSRAGGSVLYTFQASGQAFDLGASARISGHLGDGSTPLVGAEVFAETVDGASVPTIQRRALTDASGNYTLEALPTGAIYFVVSQPGGSLSAYGALASAPVNAISPTAYTADLSFTSPQTPGALTLTITPPSTAIQGTWGELRQILPTGSSGYQSLIVRSQTVATGITQDQVGFTGVAPGVYSVAAQRSTSGGTSVPKYASLQQSVAAGGTTPVSLSY
jgi:hypothetical protein